MTVSFDVNLRRRLWSDEAAAPVLRALAGRADIVFGSPDELAVAHRPPRRRIPPGLPAPSLGPRTVDRGREARSGRRARLERDGELRSRPGAAASPASSTRSAPGTGSVPGSSRRDSTARTSRQRSAARTRAGPRPSAAVGDLAGLPDPDGARRPARGRRPRHDPLTRGTTDRAAGSRARAGRGRPAHAPIATASSSPMGPRDRAGRPRSTSPATRSGSRPGPSGRPSRRSSTRGHVSASRAASTRGDPWFTTDETFRDPMARLVGRASERGRGPQLADREPAADAGLLLPARPARGEGSSPMRRSSRPTATRSAATSRRAGWTATPTWSRGSADGRGHGASRGPRRRHRASMRPSLALVLLDGVNFATGQALPVGRLTAAGHEAGAIVGLGSRPRGRQRPAGAARRRRRLRGLVHLQVPQRRPRARSARSSSTSATRAPAPTPAPDRLVGRDARPPLRPDRPVRARHGRGRLEGLDRRRSSTCCRWRVSGDLRRGGHAGPARTLDPPDGLPRRPPARARRRDPHARPTRRRAARSSRSVSPTPRPSSGS